MLVLALDLSTRCGWALGRDQETPRHGVWELPVSPALGPRLSALAASLEDALAILAPDHVCMEAPLPPQAQTAMHTARLQFGLAAVCEMVCHEQGVPLDEAAPHEVRKLIFNRARVDKQEVVIWCRARGLSPAEHNDADALALLHYRHVLFRSRVMA
jgi:crossover junction endodeoxyribonuclease RuvC